MKNQQQSPAYLKGLANAKRDHYWTHLFNSDLDSFATLAEKVDFFNGYHDGLADKYSLPRPEHTKAADLKDHYSLYIYS